jgi:hypothetical protein
MKTSTWLRIAALASAASLAGAAGAAQAAVIDISALNGTGVTVSLGAGTYKLTPVGMAGGGAYDAWNPWSAVGGCDAAGAHCSMGWNVSFAMDLGGGAGFNYGHNGGYVDTAAKALAAWQSGPNIFAPLAQASNPAAYSPLVGPITFTLAAAQDVRFFLIDYPYGDNAGGVSLDVARQVSSGVPEPSAWALMIAGFGLVGTTVRARRRLAAA